MTLQSHASWRECGKMRFQSRGASKRWARLESKRVGIRMREYACDSCTGYHITSAQGTRLPLGRDARRHYPVLP
jgi:hypothetical protein